MAMASLCFSSPTHASPTHSTRVNRYLTLLRPPSLRIDVAFASPLSPLRLGFPKHTIRIHSQPLNSADLVASSSMEDNDSIPMPVVLIDQDTDPDATIVQLSFGDRLGALLDTMKALKDLGLDVTKGSVTTEASVTKTKFFIMRMGRKVEDPDMLETIRLTIINNLLQYHPESSEKLAMGEFFGIKPPEKKLDVDVATHVHVEADGPNKSLYRECTSPWFQLLHPWNYTF
ncbi:hypothetical protein LUZ61_007279 [Rhynchospora tenuis]|uniref:ACT domain-containing protein ACR n=1 Tax=Rhynchospora tenuis TaxID=198213 RepID=A0AAD5ZTD7_9POAL|nr:hypothetical protein LUZ61_007279 [Rhynchospora tenuis]